MIVYVQAVADKGAYVEAVDLVLDPFLRCIFPGTFN